MSSEASQDQLQVVQALYAAFAKGDVATLLAPLSPDVEWVEPENPFNPAAGTRRGHAVFGHMRCRARSTGKSYESDFAHLLTFRGDKIVRFQEFFDTYAAGEAFRIG